MFFFLLFLLFFFFKNQWLFLSIILSLRHGFLLKAAAFLSRTGTQSLDELQKWIYLRTGLYSSIRRQNPQSTQTPSLALWTYFGCFIQSTVVSMHWSSGTSGLATGRSRVGRVPPLTAKNLPKEWKNWEGSFNLPLLTELAMLLPGTEAHRANAIVQNPWNWLQLYLPIWTLNDLLVFNVGCKH